MVDLEELGTLIRAEPPIPSGTIDDLRQRVDRRRRRRRAVLGSLATMVLAVGIVAAVAVSKNEPDTRLVTGTTTAVRPAPWFIPIGREQPSPPVPAGWKVLEFEALRFAVPADWIVPYPCFDMASGGGAVLLPTEELTHCIIRSPASVLRISRRSGDPTPGLATKVGTLGATEYPEGCGKGCENPYQLDVGYNLSITGPLSRRVLATFTDSGARRALMTGPVADTTGWQSIRFDGVAVQVPPSWSRTDLTRATNTTNPGTCFGPKFGNGVHPTAFTGESRFVPSCPPPNRYELEPGSGIWMRAGADSSSAVLATGHTDDGLAISAVGPGTDTQPDPALDLVVNTGTTRVTISIGVGLNAATARAILRSIHRA